MALTRIPSVEAATQAWKARFGPFMLLTLNVGTEVDAEDFLTRMTFAGRTPEGITTPDRIAVGLVDVGGADQLLIAGTLNEGECYEVFRKGLGERTFYDAQVIGESVELTQPLAAAKARAKSEGLLDPSPPGKAAADAGNHVIGALWFLLILAAILGILKFLLID